jgi:ketosteroid isomerase-like protein
VRRYLERRVQETASGFVQEHVLHVTRRDGKQFELPAAIICTVQDGRIVRLNEYLDSAHVAALRS